MFSAAKVAFSDCVCHKELKRKKQRKEQDRGGSGSGREKSWRRSVCAEKKEKGKKRKKLVYFCDAIFDLQSSNKKK